MRVPTPIFFWAMHYDLYMELDNAGDIGVLLEGI